MEDFKDAQRRISSAERTKDNQKFRTLSRRIGAGLIDSAVVLVPITLLIVALKHFDIAGKYLILIAISQLISLIYNIWFVAINGTTPGKFVFGLKIVPASNNEESVHFKHAALRELLNSASLILYLGIFVTYSIHGRLSESDGIGQNKFHDILLDIATVFGMVIGYSEILTALFNKRRRAVHDYIGGTVVVKSEMKRKVLAIILVICSVLVWYLYIHTYSLLKN